MCTPLLQLLTYAFRSWKPSGRQMRNDHGSLNLISSTVNGLLFVPYMLLFGTLLFPFLLPINLTRLLVGALRQDIDWKVIFDYQGVPSEIRFQVFLLSNIPRDLFSGTTSSNASLVKRWKTSITMTGGPGPESQRCWIAVDDVSFIVSEDIYEWLSGSIGVQIAVSHWPHSRIVARVEKHNSE